MSKFIYFDLETTGLSSKSGQILSISAVCKKRNRLNIFHRYLMPTCAITPEASRVNGFQISRGKLFKNGKMLTNVVSQTSGLTHFINFITRCRESPRKVHKEEVYLIAHNCFSFDSMMLCRSLVRLGLDRLADLNYMDNVVFADSIHMAKDKFECASYRMDALMEEFLGFGQAETHDSLSDAINLWKLSVAMAHVDYDDESVREFVERSQLIDFDERLQKCRALY